MFTSASAALASYVTPLAQAADDVEPGAYRPPENPPFLAMALAVLLIGVAIVFILKLDAWLIERRDRREAAQAAAWAARNAPPAPEEPVTAASPSAPVESAGPSSRALMLADLQRRASLLESGASPEEGSPVRDLVRRIPKRDPNAKPKPTTGVEGEVGRLMEREVAAWLDRQVAPCAWRVVHDVDTREYTRSLGKDRVGGDYDHLVFSRDGRTVFVIETKYIRHRFGASAVKGHRSHWRRSCALARVSGDSTLNVIPIFVHTRDPHFNMHPRVDEWEVAEGETAFMIDVGSMHLVELLTLWLVFPDRAGELPTAWPYAPA